MADFCGLCDGLANNDHPLGDFIWLQTAFKAGVLAPIDVGYCYNLGICEGHGAIVYFVHEDDGTYALYHAALDGKPQPSPIPVEVT